MMSDRKRQIIRISLTGIAINILLVAFKLIVGLLSHSLAIILDALNNLGDTVSALLTMIGTKIAGLPANRQHPFGYGRVEYLISIAIAVIILLTGISAMRESIVKIFSPEALDYSWSTLFVLLIALVVKYLFGRYCERMGKNLNAQTLTATGEDSITDAYISIGTIISVVIYFFFDFNIDSYIGIFISLLIIKTGYDILKETLGSIIGKKANSELIQSIEKSILETDRQINGVYDLVLHDYGPDEKIGSVHIEVEDNMTAKEIDALTRRISEKIYDEYCVILTIGIYAQNNTDPEITEIKDKVCEILIDFPDIEQMHGFYVDKVRKIIAFDLIIHYENEEYEDLIEKVKHRLEEYYPEYSYDVVRDFDFVE